MPAYLSTFKVELQYCSLLQVLEGADARPTTRSPTDHGRVSALSLSGDGAAVALGCESGFVKLYRPAKGLVKTLQGKHERRVAAIKISQDGNKLASIGEEGVIRVSA